MFMKIGIICKVPVQTRVTLPIIIIIQQHIILIVKNNFMFLPRIIVPHVSVSVVLHLLGFS